MGEWRESAEGFRENYIWQLHEGRAILECCGLTQLWCSRPAHWLPPEGSGSERTALDELLQLHMADSFL